MTKGFLGARVARVGLAIAIAGMSGCSSCRATSEDARASTDAKAATAAAPDAPEPAAGADHETARLIAACDDAAGDPADPERAAIGVADEQIIPRQAVAACVAAVEAAGTSEDGPRLLFQLGRAYVAARRHDEAEATFVRAVDAGYCAAHFQWAWFAEEQRDWATAQARYQRAIACGHPQAEASRARITWEPAGFNRPDVLDRIVRHADEDIAALNMPLRPAVAAYLGGFYKQWGNLWLSECAASRYVPGALNASLDSATIGDPRFFGERELNRLLIRVIVFFDPRYGNEGWDRYKALLEESGSIDAVRFEKKHSCDDDSPVTEALLEGLKIFTERPLPALEIVRSLHANPDQRAAVVDRLKSAGLLEALFGASAASDAGAAK